MSRFELMNAAFRGACERLNRFDLLKGGTFATSATFLERETGCQQYGDPDEAPTGVTFVLGRPEPEYIDLGRIDHDVFGEALRFRRVSYCEVRSGQPATHASADQYPPYLLRSEGLQAILDEMLRSPQVARLEADIFEPILDATPVLRRALEIVSEVLGQPVGSSMRERLFHDWADERDNGHVRAHVLPIKLRSFELARYPRFENLERQTYFDNESAGPVQLTFWVLPSLDRRSLTRVAAMPQFSWWRSPSWGELGRRIDIVPDLHVTHRRYFAAQDWHRTQELLSKWRPLALRLASELGAEGLVFEDAASSGSHLYETLPALERPMAVVEVTERLGDEHAERRARSEPPPGCSVLPLSTPVVAFGDWMSARVATLGLNPSSAEFVDGSGQELDGRERRLETLASLGAASPGELSSAQVRKLLDSCRDYFHRNPYRRWFDVLEGVLTPLGASYYDGSACHLDLSPWATEPRWGMLPAATRESLIRDGTQFLLEQLRNSFIHVLLLNGTGVVSAFQGATGANLRVSGNELVDGRLRSTFWSGWFEGIAVVGWSVNLQSSFGVSAAFRAAVAERVRRMDFDFFT